MTAETTQGTAEAEAAEQPTTWLFTFGAEVPALEHKFVRIHGTFMEARLRMLSIYKHRWCAQYASAEDAGVELYGLTELTLPFNLGVTR